MKYSTDQSSKGERPRRSIFGNEWACSFRQMANGTVGNTTLWISKHNACSFFVGFTGGALMTAGTPTKAKSGAMKILRKYASEEPPGFSDRLRAVFAPWLDAINRVQQDGETKGEQDEQE